MMLVDPTSANAQDKDRTFIRLIIIFKYGLGISKIVFMIMTICYFLGVIWQVITVEMHHIFEDTN